MSFKFPTLRPVVQTPVMVTAGPVTVVPMPVLGALDGLDFYLSGKRDAMYSLYKRFKDLPQCHYIERARRSTSALTYKQAKLYVYDALSEAAQYFGMPDIFEYPDQFIEVNFPNFNDVSAPLDIQLTAKCELGNRLIVELEQLETTVELRDWHK